MVKIIQVGGRLNILKVIFQYVSPAHIDAVYIF